MPLLTKGADAMKGICKDTALTGAGFERTKLLRGTATYGCRAPGRKRYRRDSGPAYAALDMPVPDTYAVVVRGETHQMD